MANDKHHMVVLHLMVKADTASEAQSFAETVLLKKVQEWFHQDLYEEPPFKDGSLLMFNLMVEEVAPVKCEILWGDIHNDDDAPEATGVAICGTIASPCCERHGKNCSGRDAGGWTYITLDEIAAGMVVLLLGRSQR